MDEEERLKWILNDLAERGSLDVVSAVTGFTEDQLREMMGDEPMSYTHRVVLAAHFPEPICVRRHE